MNYGHNKKKIIFSETDKRHAELKIRLNYDGLSQQAFFSSIVNGYLSSDEDIVKFISKTKEGRIYTPRRRERELPMRMRPPKKMRRNLA